MNKTAKLAQSFLNGEVISILTGFKRFFITNVPREAGRAIERKFLVKLDRKKKEFKNKDGDSGYYYEYRLLHTTENSIGIEKMRSYVAEQIKEQFKPNIKRGPKTIHVKTDNPKQAPLEFNTSTGSRDDAIN